MGQLATLKKSLLLICLSCSLSGYNPQMLLAQDEPPELRATIEAMESAANQKNLEALMNFYSPEFTNTDGLRQESVASAIEQLWQNYPRAQYEITLDAWERAGEQVVAETTTQIQGSRIEAGRFLRLNSTIRSRQYFQGEKLVSQEIISEATEVSSGEVPAVRVNVPETVQVREQFNFDVILEEPLENSVILGGAIEEQTGSDRYLNPSEFELEALPSGGIFKLVTAPGLPGSYWLSAVIIQGDGMITVTRRVTVEAK